MSVQCTDFLGKLLKSGRKEQTGLMFERSIVHDSVLSNVLEDCFLFSQKTPCSLLVYCCHVKNGSYRKKHNTVLIVIW